MRVFLTGATGFIGSAIVTELIAAGHQVIGLTRSDEGAKFLIGLGAEPHRGDLTDLDSLRSGAAKSDAVLHCGFQHDFSKFKESSEIDKLAIEAIGAVLAGSDRPFIVSSGLGGFAPGRLTTENDNPPDPPQFPRVSEQAAMALLALGVNSGVMRLPQVHDPVKQGLVTPLVAIAREKGISTYIGEGKNRWPAAHVLDTAKLYRLALEQHQPGAKYHAVAEEGVALRDIAEAIGRGLKIPAVSITQEEAGAHFGFFSHFVGFDLGASSAITRERLGWNPTGPGMIEDLNNMKY